MKKTLLSLACALCVSAAFAGEITDDFTAKNMPGMPTAASAETAAVTSGNGVEYTFTNCNRNNANNVFLFNAEGATFTAKLAEQCSKIVFTGNSNQGAGKIALSVNGVDVVEASTTTEQKNFTFEIPEEYQAAGTVYTFTRKTGNNRLLSITYTTIEKELEYWATPEFNISDNSYVLAGQNIAVTNLEEGATLELSYRVNKNGEPVKVEGNSFEIPADTKNLSNIFVTAIVSGEGKESAKAEITVKFTNGKRPIIDSFVLDKCDVNGSTATFDYSIGIVNLAQNTAKIAVTVNVLNEAGEVVATATNDTNNNKPEESDVATYAEGVEPVLPVIVSKSVVVENLKDGNYTFTISHQIGENAAEEVNLDGKNSFTVTTTTTSINDINIDNSNSEAIYYDIAGNRVNAPRAGQIVIRIANGKASKVIF